MSSIMNAITDILAKLGRLLGLKASEEGRMEAVGRKLAAAKADNVDRLEALKSKIKQLEAQALRKKKEYDVTRGESKRVVGAEIQRAFRDLDRLKDTESVLSSNLERLSITQAKLDAWLAARVRGVDEDELDDLALELQQAFDDLGIADRAAKDLEGVTYKGLEGPDVNIEDRLAQTGSRQTTAVELPADVAERLSQLESEHE